MGRKMDITQVIERVPAFEDRLSVRLEALSAFAEGPDDDGDWKILLNGELHPMGGETLDRDLEVNASAYDSSGRVVSTESNWISSDDFFGFEAFTFSFYAPVKVAKIRLYPKAR